MSLVLSIYLFCALCVCDVSGSSEELSSVSTTWTWRPGYDEGDDDGAMLFIELLLFLAIFSLPLVPISWISSLSALRVFSCYVLCRASIIKYFILIQHIKYVSFHGAAVDVRWCIPEILHCFVLRTRKGEQGGQYNMGNEEHQESWKVLDPLYNNITVFNVLAWFLQLQKLLHAHFYTDHDDTDDGHKKWNQGKMEESEKRDFLVVSFCANSGVTLFYPFSSTAVVTWL